MNRSNIFSKAANVFLSLISGICFAATPATVEAPDLFMQDLTNRVLKEVKNLPEGDMQDLYLVVDKEIIPYIDLDYMSKWVAGRKAWANASSDQRQKFQEVFQNLLTRTYSSTLFVFRDREVVYSRPPRVDYTKAKTIPVSCEVKQPNKESIQVIYQLRLVNKQWKVFDILVEGVSMLKGLQTQYEQVIAEKGLPGAITLMQQKSQEKSMENEKRQKQSQGAA